MKMIGPGLALALSIAGVLVAGAGAVSSGCNGNVSCQSYCQDRTAAGCYAGADGGTTMGSPTNCSSACSAQTAAVSAGQCTSLYQNYLDCADTSESICSVGTNGDTQCISETQDYQACFMAYCSANASDPACSTYL
jgi:hypothetical protein